MPHLPAVPDHFVKELIERSKSQTYDADEMEKRGMRTVGFKHRTIIHNGKQSMSRGQEIVHMGDEFTDWIRENIASSFVEVEGRVNISPDGKTTTHGAHVDNPGKIRLYYLVDPGGADVETLFFMKPGGPVVHDMDSHKSAEPIHHLNMDELIVIDRARFPVGQWVLFNGYVMHGITGVTGPRLNFTVNFKPDQINYFIKPKQ